MRALVILLIGLLAGCVVYRGDGQPKQAVLPPEASEHQSRVTPWLNPLAQISSQRRVTAPAGMDIRQALYCVEAESGSPSVLLRLRDYSTVSDGKPDPQRVELLRVDDGTSETQALPAEAAPINLLVSPNKRAWVLCSVKAGSASLDNPPIQLSASAAELSQAEFTAEQRMLPLGFLDPQTLLARPVKAIQVDNGLPVASLDWDSPAQRYNLKTHLTLTDEAGLFYPSPYGNELAGYTIDYKPVLPSQASIAYYVTTSGAAQPRHLTQFSYHVSYSAFPWQPPLLWATGDTLATMQFLPDATGVSTKPNHNGLFRLVTINTQDGGLSLVEDHLPPGVPVAAGDGVLFYTRQQLAGEKARWELWASSADGLLKQRLWRPDDDTVYLSVEDAYAGSRLLVHRQYFKLSGQQPQLISEMQEFSIVELPGGEAQLEFQPHTPPQPLTSSGDLMQAPASDGVPPLHMPD